MIDYFRALRARSRDDEGASGVEYGLLVAAIAAVIVVLAFAIGGYVAGAFDDTCNAIKANGSGSTTSTADCNPVPAPAP